MTNLNKNYESAIKELEMVQNQFLNLKIGAKQNAWNENKFDVTRHALQQQSFPFISSCVHTSALMVFLHEEVDVWCVQSGESPHVQRAFS